MPVATQAIPLDSFAVVWQRPLFMPDRKPTPPVATQPPGISLDRLELTGTMLTGPLQIALVHDRASNRDVRVRLHGSYQGWTLVTVERRRAVFSRTGEVAELVLPTPRSGAKPGNMPPIEQQGGVTLDSEVSASSATSPASSASEAAEGVVMPPHGRQDDAAARQTQLDALKRAVIERRHHAPSVTGAH